MMALYRSIVTQDADVVVHILALDGVTLGLFHDLCPKANVWPLGMLERQTEGLLLAKANRTWQEYCWTLGSVWTHHLRANMLSSTTFLAYVDADCYFFQSPRAAWESHHEADVVITPHRWAPLHRDRLRPNGTYNVGWVRFGTSIRARWLLKRWRDQTLAWCHNRHEDGKFGDQLYLEDWPESYGVTVSRHLGINLGPWAQEQYSYEAMEHSLEIIEDSGRWPVVLYHFHELDCGRAVPYLSGYRLHPAVRTYLYDPYVAHLAEIRAEIDDWRAHV